MKVQHVASLTLLALAGCQAASVSLLRTAPLPAGDSCAEGGIRVQSGLDSDGDGVLQDGEVTSTADVCHGTEGESGADGATGDAGASATEVLLEVVPVPADAACPSGGIEVRSGHDDDGDGVLDSDEVEAEERVCHGADGADGTDGAAGTDGTDGHGVLLEVTTLAAGAECAAGGIRVRSGVDDDGDGVLDESEVDADTVVCDGEDAAPVTDPVVTGDYTVADPASLAALAGVTEITGDLVIGGGVAGPVELANLVTVGGSVTASGASGLTGLGFPALTSIGGSLQLSSNPRFETLEAPALQGVGGDVQISSNPVLTSVPTFDALLAVYGQVSVNDNASLVRLNGLSALTTAESVQISGNGALETFVGLESITSLPGSLTIEGNTSLTTLTGLDRLVEVHGDITVDDTAVVDLVLFPALRRVGGALAIERNVGTRRISGFDGLDAVGTTLSIRSNPDVGYIEGFGVLTRVGSEIIVADNRSLACLDVAVYRRFEGSGSAVTIESPACP